MYCYKLGRSLLHLGPNHCYKLGRSLLHLGPNHCYKLGRSLLQVRFCLMTRYDFIVKLVWQYRFYMLCIAVCSGGEMCDEMGVDSDEVMFLCVTTGCILKYRNGTDF